MNLKSKRYAMDVICACDHIEKILNERVPLGERGEVLAEILNMLVFGVKQVETPELIDAIRFTYFGETGGEF